MLEYNSASYTRVFLRKMDDDKPTTVILRGITSTLDVKLDSFELERTDADAFVEYATERFDPTEFAFYGIDALRAPGLRRHVLNVIFPDRTSRAVMKEHYDKRVYGRLVEPFFRAQANGTDPSSLFALAARTCGRLERNRLRSVLPSTIVDSVRLSLVRRRKN